MQYEHVNVCEVSPRDGLQMAHQIMPTNVKLQWIRQLAASGLKEIEVGSFVNPKLVPRMADSAAIVQGAIGIEGLTVCALAANLKGAIAAHEAGAHVLCIPVSASETHSLANVNKSTDAQIDVVRSIVDYVRAQPRPMRIDAAVATAFGCSMEGNVSPERVGDVASALKLAGANEVTLSDTVGYAHPAQIKSLVRLTQDRIGSSLTKLHLHDTMGLGLANALAGLQDGIRNFDACLAGLGGCPFAPNASGNIVTEDLIFLLESMSYTTGVDLGRLIQARQLLGTALPEETLRGGVAAAGIPKTFHAKTTAFL